MKAVWSFWSKPYWSTPHPIWANERYHLLSWILSFECARKHYPDTMLITDDNGARLLIDMLHLDFSEVSTALNNLRDYDIRWWSLGKIWAYRAQKEPFIHIDNDVFMWKRLPHEVETAPLFAQNPENLNDYNYDPSKFTEVSRKGGWIPEELSRFSAALGEEIAICCGILGGHRVDFISDYADKAMKLAERSENIPLWPHVGIDTLLLEQCTIYACYKYHRARPDSPFQNISIRYLFNSFSEAFTEQCAAALGYTHLIAAAKKNMRFLSNLENHVKTVYPEHYERCIRYVEGRP
jgi:hypothetical protein